MKKVRNIAQRYSAKPSALAINSSALRMLKSYDKLDFRTKIFIGFIDNSSSFEMLSQNEMRLSSRGVKESIGMSGKNLPSFIKQMPAGQ